MRKLKGCSSSSGSPGWGAGLEAAQREALFHQGFRQGGGGVGAVGAAVIVGFPHKDPPAQRGAGGDDQRLAAVVAAQRREDAGDPAVLNIGGHDLRLVDVQPGGLFQGVFHPDMVAFAVGLHPQAVHGGAFAPVEHPALQKGGVGGQAHQPAQGVDLPYQVALGGAADGGVAGHIADKIQRQGEDGGFGAQHRRRVGGLDTGVPRAHHNDVVGS